MKHAFRPNQQVLHGRDGLPSGSLSVVLSLVPMSSSPGTPETDAHILPSGVELNWVSTARAGSQKSTLCKLNLETFLALSRHWDAQGGPSTAVLLMVTSAWAAQASFWEHKGGVQTGGGAGAEQERRPRAMSLGRMLPLSLGPRESWKLHYHGLAAVRSLQCQGDRKEPGSQERPVFLWAAKQETLINFKRRRG